MSRVPHGGYLSLEAVESALNKVRADSAASPEMSVVTRATSNFTRLYYMFEGLQEENANTLLPVNPQTNQDLINLGLAMRDPFDPEAVDGEIPAIYTYFGQFVDHDVTLEAASDEIIGRLQGLFDPAMIPFSKEDIVDKIKNTRTATLDLDSIYDGARVRLSEDGQKFVIGTVSPAGGQRPNRADGDDANDLLRDPATKEALIADGRNDENLVIAQLHLAFLRAHNALVVKHGSHEVARTVLTQHYQWVVVHDFLKRIVDPSIVDSILTNGNRFYLLKDDEFFLPLEYTVAAYRFGHSMIRALYDFNEFFPASRAPGVIPGSLQNLFRFTGSGGFAGAPTLPENWIIEWKKFVDDVANVVRPLDTKIAEPLFELGFANPQTPRSSLAARNLLRGYLLRMPTGQAVATAMGFTPLTPDQIKSAANDAAQVEVLERNNDELATRTPLWYYILAEAAAGGGLRLGPVGGTIVAEVLIELVRRSRDSILQVPGGWTPTLPAIGEKFILEDILVLAGVHTPALVPVGA